MSIQDQLIVDIEAFIARHRLTASRFGLLAFGNPHIVRRIKMGQGISVPRADTLYAWMAKYDQSQSRIKKKPNRDRKAA